MTIKQVAIETLSLINEFLPAIPIIALIGALFWAVTFINNIQLGAGL